MSDNWWECPENIKLLEALAINLNRLVESNAHVVIVGQSPAWTGITAQLLSEKNRIPRKFTFLPLSSSRNVFASQLDRNHWQIEIASKRRNRALVRYLGMFGLSSKEILEDWRGGKKTYFIDYCTSGESLATVLAAVFSDEQMRQTKCIEGCYMGDLGDDNESIALVFDSQEIRLRQIEAPEDTLGIDLKSFIHDTLGHISEDERYVPSVDLYSLARSRDVKKFIRTSYRETPKFRDIILNTIAQHVGRNPSQQMLEWGCDQLMWQNKESERYNCGKLRKLFGALAY